MKRIVSTPFDQPAPPTRKGAINGWQAGIGEWSVKDGALRGDELAENNHPSSCTYRCEATDMIILPHYTGPGKGLQLRLDQLTMTLPDQPPPNVITLTEH